MVSSSSVWFGSTLFLSLGFFTTLAALLPLGLSAEAVLMPDLFFCMAFCWVVRSAKTAPITIVFLVAFFSDLLLMRPLGLWTFIVVLSMEFTRYQRHPIREQMFIVEWVLFALLFGCALLFQSMLLAVSFSDLPDFDLTMWYFVTTVLAYPIVVIVLYYVFGIRVEKTPSGNQRLGRVQ